MTVDNFSQIEKLLSFSNKNEFYMLQIMQRSKDGGCQFDDPDRSKSDTRIIKTYYVSSPDYLAKKKKEIVALCELFNARATINLNKKSYDQVGYKMIKEIVDIIAGGLGLHKIRGVFESVIGQVGACDGNKRWIIDVDTKNMDDVDCITNILNKVEPIGVAKVISVIPTLHGFHIITSPFRKDKFQELYKYAFTCCEVTNEHIDVHDNNPTLLYYKEV